MNFETVTVSLDQNIATVRLNRPEKANAMNLTMWHDIRKAFNWIDENAEARVAVIEGEGKHFTSGIDLQMMMGLLPSIKNECDGRTRENLRRVILDLQDTLTAIERCRKPVIAAVHGHCIGGGVDLTTACDIRLCTADATFSIHETKVAIVADLGTLQRLTGIVGKGFAREMAFTGKRIIAERAHHFGLVNDVYTNKDELLAAARAMAMEIASNPPLVVQGVKQVLQFSEEHSIQEGLEYIAQWNAARLQIADLQEAMTAFREKRPPVFTGQ